MAETEASLHDKIAKYKLDTDIQTKGLKTD